MQETCGLYVLDLGTLNSSSDGQQSKQLRSSDLLDEIGQPITLTREQLNPTLAIKRQMLILY